MSADFALSFATHVWGKTVLDFWFVSMAGDPVARDAAKVGNQRAGVLEVRNIPDDRNEPRSDLCADAKNLLQLTVCLAIKKSPVWPIRIPQFGH